MGFNGSGAFSIDTFGNPVVDDTEISPTVHNATMDEIAAGLTACITKDGQTTITANIPFNGNRITGLESGSAQTDAASIANLIGNTGKYTSSVGGTVDAITLVPFPAHTNYNVGQELFFIATGDNTGAVTVNVSSLGAKDIQKMGAVALAAGDLVSGALVHIVYDGTRFLLLSPPIHEGTWTPSIGGTATYTSRVGRWTKNGRTVTFWGTMVINALGTGSSNIISGLPFSAANISMNGSIAVGNFSTLAVNVVWLGAHVVTNTSTVALVGMTAAGASAVATNFLGNGTSITFGGSYYL